VAFFLLKHLKDMEEEIVFLSYLYTVVFGGNCLLQLSYFQLLLASKVSSFCLDVIGSVGSH